MSNRLFILSLFVLLFAASAFANPVLVFTQNIKSDTSSSIRADTDFAAMKNYVLIVSGTSGEVAWTAFSKTMETLLSGACVNITGRDKGTSCEVNGLVLSLTRNFTTKDGYYTFEVTGEFPYRTYSLTVNRVPLDRFGRSIQIGLGPEGNAPFTEATALDLRRKEDNVAVSNGYKALGLGLQYVVNMPGEVTAASAGNYTAEISGSTASFDLVGVMEDSAPLKVQSRELNLLLISLLAGVLLLLFLIYAFFSTKKKK